MSVFDVAATVAVTLSALLTVSTLTRLRRLRRDLSTLRHTAHHDPLTGLLNRTGLSAAWPTLAPSRPAVVLLDLDKFKPVNDTYGHAAGDHVLTTIADRLRTASLDAVARLGGDEFVLILPTRPDLPSTVARVGELISAPVLLPGGHEVSVTGSLGITFTDCDHLSTLLADADAAMYQAKTSGALASTYSRDREDGSCLGCSRPGIRVRDMYRIPTPRTADVG